MSLGQPRFKTSGAGFPRVGGDEPLQEALLKNGA